MAKTRITVSLLGQLRNSVHVIEAMRDKIREAEHWTADSEDDDPADSADYYAFALGEVAGHIEGVHRGEYDVADFCDFYGIRPDAPASPAPAPKEAPRA